MTSYSLPEKPVQVCRLLKHDVRVKFFDINCVEMGVEAVEMDQSDVSFKMIPSWCQLESHLRVIQASERKIFTASFYKFT